MHDIGNTLIEITFLILIFGVFPGCLIHGFLRRRAREKALWKAITLSNVDYMSGLDFERYVAKLLQNQGYRTQLTRHSGDLGVDIIAERGGVKTAIQVKRQVRPVSRRAVSDVVTGKLYYKVDKALVVTNAWFTHGAQTLAKSTDCRLVDREQLSQWILSFQAVGHGPATPALKPIGSPPKP